MKSNELAQELDLLVLSLCGEGQIFSDITYSGVIWTAKDDKVKWTMAVQYKTRRSSVTGKNINELLENAIEFFLKEADNDFNKSKRDNRGSHS